MSAAPGLKARWRRPVARLRVPLAVAAVALVAGGASLAYAAEPRPDNPQGAAVTITTSPVTPTSIVAFTGTGFTTNGRGEVLMLKLDDSAIVLADKTDEWGTYTAAADGTVSGTVDLSRAHADTPLTAGRHWLRFLTGSKQAGDTPRTLHVDFTVEAPAVTPTTPVQPTTGPVAPTTPAPTTPPIVKSGPVWLLATTTKPSKTKLTLKLKAGALGSAGQVRVRAKHKVKVGKGKAKRWVIAKSDAYFVDKLGEQTVRLKLTAEGKTLIKRAKVLKVIVELADANGEDTVRQEVWVTR